MVGERAGVGYWGGNLGVCRGGVSWRSISDRSGDLSDDWGNGFDGNGVTGWFAVYDGVEAVVWVSGVLHDALGAVGLDEGVVSPDDVAVALFVLALGVAGQTVLDVVGEAVLWVWVVVVDWGGDDGLGYWGGVCERAGVFGYWGGVGKWGSYFSDWGSVRHRGWVVDDAGAGDSDHGGQDYVLCTET